VRRIQSKVTALPSRFALGQPCAPEAALRATPFEIAVTKQHRPERKGDRKRRHEKCRETVPCAGGIEVVQAGINGQRRNHSGGERRARRVAEHPFGDGADDERQHDQDRKRLHVSGGGPPQAADAPPRGAASEAGVGVVSSERRVRKRLASMVLRRLRLSTAVRRDQASSFLSSVILAFRSFDTGQPDFAFSAAVSNACWLAPGMRAVNSRCTAGITNAPPDFSRVTVAFV